MMLHSPKTEPPWFQFGARAGFHKSDSSEGVTALLLRDLHVTGNVSL